MKDERYKAIMGRLGQPNSQSLLIALQQVENETAQEINKYYRDNALCNKCLEIGRDGEHSWHCRKCGKKL